LLSFVNTVHCTGRKVGAARRRLCQGEFCCCAEHTPLLRSSAVLPCVVLLLACRRVLAPSLRTTSPPVDHTPLLCRLLPSSRAGGRRHHLHPRRAERHHPPGPHCQPGELNRTPSTQCCFRVCGLISAERCIHLPALSTRRAEQRWFGLCGAVSRLPAELGAVRHCLLCSNHCAVTRTWEAPGLQDLQPCIVDRCACNSAALSSFCPAVVLGTDQGPGLQGGRGAEPRHAAGAD